MREESQLPVSFSSKNEKAPSRTWRRHGPRRYSRRAHFRGLRVAGGRCAAVGGGKRDGGLPCASRANGKRAQAGAPPVCGGGSGPYAGGGGGGNSPRASPHLRRDRRDRGGGAFFLFTVWCPGGGVGLPTSPASLGKRGGSGNGE